MNLSYFISKRINQGHQTGFSATIHKIAVASIAIGLAASLVSFLVMKGFQETVKNKIYGFSGHLILTKFTTSNSPEEIPVNYHEDVYDHPEKYPFVKHVQEFAHKAGLVKTEDEVLGVVIKGVGPSFDIAGFKHSMIEGEFIQFPDSSVANQVVISKIIANKIRAKVGDDIIVHFFQNPPRFRKLKVTGIYETNLSEYFDSRVILSDIRMIKKLNDWPDSVAGGIEVFLDFNYFDKSDLWTEQMQNIATEDWPLHLKLIEMGNGLVNYDHHEAVLDKSVEVIGASMDYNLYIERVSDRYQQVFEWLKLLSRQVTILLCIILIVVCVNMISIVLILVMERTQMIGMLKALGASNKTVRSVFVYNGISLIVKGLAMGNLVGLGLCAIQHYFEVVKLNPHDYYMSFVPISWHWEIVLILNLITFLVVTVVLLIPTMVIARINPIKAIRFD
ncbi:MAG TPA: FtsX-like permease family protein [Ohtaekwangia sp.]|nr:FtsX-like permease family protein [Ohtaekwangia sp.]